MKVVSAVMVAAAPPPFLNYEIAEVFDYYTDPVTSQRLARVIPATGRWKGMTVTINLEAAWLHLEHSHWLPTATSHDRITPTIRNRRSNP